MKYLLYVPLLLVFVFLVPFIQCNPIIDGVIGVNEWPANSALLDYVNNTWYFTWDGSSLFTGYKAATTKTDTFCLYQTHPESWRYPNYTAEGTSFLSTVQPGVTIALAITANVLIKCTVVPPSCDYYNWFTPTGWVVNTSVPLTSAYTPSSVEFKIPYESIANSDGLTYVACYTTNDQSPIGVPSSVYNYLGLDLNSNIPVSTNSFLNTFPAVTSSDGSWSTTYTPSWTAENAPSSSEEYSDVNAIIKHQVTVDDAAYATSLTVTASGSLTIPFSSSLTLGLTCPSRYSFESALVINGTFTCQGYLILHTFCSIYSPSILTINNLALNLPTSGYGNTYRLYAPINVTGSLEIESGVYLYQYSNGFYYTPGSTLRYLGSNSSSYTVVGAEWKPSANLTSWNTPYSVQVPFNVSVYLSGEYGDNQTFWVWNSLIVSGNFTFSSQGILDVLLLQVTSSGLLSTNNIIRMSSYSIEPSATVTCSANGAILHSDGSSWRDFQVQLYEPNSGHTEQWSDYSVEYNAQSDGEVQISVDGSYGITDSTAITWDLSGVQSDQLSLTTVSVTSSGTLSVKIRLAPDYCWRTKKVTINMKDNGRGGGDTTGLIIGVVAIGAAVLALGSIIFGLVRWRKNKNKKQKKQDNNNDEELAMRQEKEKSPAPKKESVKIKDEWEIKFNDIKIGNQLGRGAFGIVYKAQWRNTDCVVKQMDVSKSDQNSINQFLKEVNNVKSLRVHPNVCMILGVCTDPDDPICIVMEYLSEGSLDNLIYNSIIEVDTRRVLQFSKDIASGMSHLHAENVLHCDLACRNILVSNKGGNNYILKIADFGLSKVTETAEYNASSPNTQFPIRWSSPETLRAGKVSRASDVWSFGVVMWEICEAKRPYPELTNPEVIKAVCDDGVRLRRPTKVQIPDELDKLMRECWQAPQQRPSFDQIYAEICRIEDLYYPTPDKKKVEDPVFTSTSYNTNYTANNYQDPHSTEYHQMSTSQNTETQIKVDIANQGVYGNANS